jgi:hypothetical protein
VALALLVALPPSLRAQTPDRFNWIGETRPDANASHAMSTLISFKGRKSAVVYTALLVIADKAGAQFYFDVEAFEKITGSDPAFHKVDMPTMKNVTCRYALEFILLQIGACCIVHKDYIEIMPCRWCNLQEQIHNTCSLCRLI